ncbi:MAG TPA: DUF72 domain-containing protein [Sphingomicrobium sp.]
MLPVIGTASWAIPATDRDVFQAPGTSLERYSSVLRGAEVNSSFHRPHRRTTWERWAASVPDGFQFAAKMPKEISHVRRLVDARAPLEQFLDQVTGLGDKLKLLLLQLPPSFAYDESTTSLFLDLVASLTDTPLVCEPRHGSWFEAEAGRLLVSRRVARVAADPASVPDAAHPGGWRGVTYMRLHGSPVMYRSAYGEDRLQVYASRITEDVAAGRPVWCMFDNTAASAALGDALTMTKLLEVSCPISRPVRSH